MAAKKTILIPTDFSEPARFALEEGLRIARRDEAELVILHVAEEFHPPAGHVVEHHSFPNLADEIQKGARRQLDELLAELDSGDVPCRGMIKTGMPSVEIADAADELNADLVVIASRGLSALKRFFLGSTTERLVRIANRPVLVVRNEDESAG